MSSATTIAVVASCVVAAAGAAYSGYTQSEAADEQKDLLNKQAQQETASAETQAQLIRDKAVRVEAQQANTMAAAGLKLDGSGTGQALMDETKNLADRDALTVIKNAHNKAELLNAQANIASDQSTAYAVGGALGATGSLLKGASTYSASSQNSQLATRINSSNYSLLGGQKLTW